MVELDKDGWRRLHAEVLVMALRMTRTRDASQEATQRDRAREATQEAFDRLLRVRPADLDSLEALKKYLVKSVRSALSNVSTTRAVRGKYEEAAMTEQATVQGRAVASAEDMQLESADERRRSERAARTVARLREELADDAVALGTIDCIERGVTEPADQAHALGRPVEEIYLARKRRKRALASILEEARADVDEEKP